jgi:uncharacterized tellurite resistance protein B-like protein
MMIFSIILCLACVYLLFWGARWECLLDWLSGKKAESKNQWPMGGVSSDGSIETKVEVKKNSFCVCVRGVIDAPSAQHQINICIELRDVTEQDAGTSCVYSLSEQFKHPITKTFAYQQYKGSLPEKHTQISDWMEVANIETSALRFARMGTRRLLFKVSITSCASREELAGGCSVMLYDNTLPGYMDMAYNSLKAGRLAVILALSNVGQVSREQVDITASWFEQNLAVISEHIPKPSRQQIEKAIQQGRKFLRRGGTIDIAQICDQIRDIADSRQRLDIIELCLRVAVVDCRIAEDSLAAINRIAWLLKVEYSDYIRKLESKMAFQEAGRYSAQSLLGIVPEMDEQCVCRLLNDEYRRWNGCVTSFDGSIRNRALEMIERISHIRNQYNSKSLPRTA